MNPDYADYWRLILNLPEYGLILFGYAKADLLRCQFLDDFLSETKKAYPYSKTEWNRIGSGRILDRKFTVTSYHGESSYNKLRATLPHLAFIHHDRGADFTPGYNNFISMLESRMRDGGNIIHLN